MTLKFSVVIATIVLALQPFAVLAQENPSDAGSFSTQSCQPFIDQGSSGQIDKDALLRRRQEAGAWGQDKTGETERVDAEAAFEYFAMQSIGDYPPTRLQGILNTILSIAPMPKINYFASRTPRELKFNSPYRTAKTAGVLKNVVPDGIADSTVIVTEMINGVPKRKTLRVTNGVFFEAKTSLGLQYLSSGSGNTPDGSWQIGGFIDALDNLVTLRVFTMNASLRGTGFSIQLDRSDVPAPLFFLTPSSTRWSQQVIDFATERNVLLYRVVACDYLGVGGQLGVNDLVMGAGIPLNLNVLPTSYQPSFARGTPGKPGTAVRVVPPSDDGGGGGIYN